MSDIQVSICASAMRTGNWMNFYNSLKGNKVNWEVIFVGPNKPDFALPKNFIFIQTNVKPCQCYEIAYRQAQGELIHWTADDAYYDGVGDNNIDKAYNFYKKMNNRKLVVAMRPIEDGRDIWFRHHLFGDAPKTPRMAPLGLMNREFFHELGGYDIKFISGQSENDIVMRVLEAGGAVEIDMESYIHINHRQCHEQWGKSGMRQYYVADRQVLENLWIIGGYGGIGTGGILLRDGASVSKKRLAPVESFVSNDTFLTYTQGNKGTWT